jgi:dolichyl-phosphate-mannose--protein O-mannosyl transferase
MNPPVMMERTREASPRPGARITGFVYLLYFLTAVLAEFLVRGLVVSGDAAATANNILAHQALYRLGLATALIATACYVAVTALFYNLFKPLNRSLSLLAAFFSLLGCAIQALRCAGLLRKRD